MAASELRPIDSLRLHPDSERVPLASSADLRALRASLEENGQQDPIDITDDGLILDGRTRWTLLRDLGSLTVLVRVVEIPSHQQTHYIIDRALARRHLTADQKQALNALLKAQVLEVDTNPKTGEERRIGLGQSQRADRLGVDRDSVKRWDREAEVGGVNTPPTSAPPTHFREEGRGRVMPLHPDRKPAGPKAPRAQTTRPTPPRPKRFAPPWQRHFTLWCRAVLPEDRKYLIQMSEELHKALARLDLACGQQEGTQS